MSIKKENLRIVFMGTPDFAKGSLKALLDNAFNVVGVFCKPDKPKGRGMKLLPPPVKELAMQSNIPVFQPENLKSSEEILSIVDSIKPDLVIVVAYGKILPEYILNYPKYGCINVHGSLLPKYRGAAPIQWAIINGETLTGITTMYMDKGMDTGNMITKTEVIIDKEDTYGTLHDKLMQVGASTLVKDLERLLEQDGKLDSTVQAENYTIAPMLTKDNTKIDFNNPKEVISNLVRGTNPNPTAWCKLDDERVYKIYKASGIEYNEFTEAEIGEIVCLNDKKNLFIVRCKDGYINLELIKPAGSKIMTAGEYIRGGKIMVGEKFGDQDV